MGSGRRRKGIETYAVNDESRQDAEER